ncbi:uncharacterized protein KY384_006552 [Bacidia gigantensis]|uniref:uncharacterized protein n=1 Tax=Bacidia gigantensis TaxID=2732470 RepID=UPI001D053813|nr:uncharacterized protein KY384_006552 [Bacidia gigantensis]KAG8528863.1 hypothetical protein KY384_006552 [Bacidia gigantensis]
MAEAIRGTLLCSKPTQTLGKRRWEDLDPSDQDLLNSQKSTKRLRTSRLDPHRPAKHQTALAHDSQQTKDQTSPAETISTQSTPPDAPKRDIQEDPSKILKMGQENCSINECHMESDGYVKGKIHSYKALKSTLMQRRKPLVADATYSISRKTGHHVSFGASKAEGKRIGLCEKNSGRKGSPPQTFQGTKKPEDSKTLNNTPPQKGLAVKKPSCPILHHKKEPTGEHLEVLRGQAGHKGNPHELNLSDEKKISTTSKAQYVRFIDYLLHENEIDNITAASMLKAIEIATGVDLTKYRRSLKILIVERINKCLEELQDFTQVDGHTTSEENDPPHSSPTNRKHKRENAEDDELLYSPRKKKPKASMADETLPSVRTIFEGATCEPYPTQIRGEDILGNAYEPTDCLDDFPQQPQLFLRDGRELKITKMTAGEPAKDVVRTVFPKKGADPTAVQLLADPKRKAFEASRYAYITRKAKTFLLPANKFLRDRRKRRAVGPIELRQCALLKARVANGTESAAPNRGIMNIFRFKSYRVDKRIGSERKHENKSRSDVDNA